MNNTNTKDCVNLSNFDFGIDFGNLITGSDYIWCVNSRDAGLQIKNIKDQSDISSAYHNFGIASTEKYTIVCAKDFEFNQQHFLLVSLEINSHKKRYLLALFQISISKVVCSFEVPHNVSKIEIIVKNHHYIENSKNPNILRVFDVTAVCGCNGGAVYMFDITPHDELGKWNSDEYNPLSVYWYKNIDFTDFDEISYEKMIAFRQSQIFGLHLNYKSIGKDNFSYIMSDEQVKAVIPANDVQITTLKYEKQLDSLLVGFGFGCFQIWNLKTMSIEISTGYGENTRPIIGFSLLQPQNDPKKCIYLLVSHSSVVNLNKRPQHARPKSSDISMNKSIRKSLLENELNKIGNINETRISHDDDDDFEIDDDEDENSSSFILLYQIMFDRCVNIFLNQNESYYLYENIQSSAIVFRHSLTSETLDCVETNNLNDLNHLKSKNYLSEDSLDSNFVGLSKIISIQTLNTQDKQSQIDLACIIWTLLDRNSPSISARYYLSIFNLNNWYISCMPSKLNNVKGLKRNENIFFSNFSLPLNEEFDTIKLFSIIDSKLKSLFNQNILSYGNNLKSLINSNSSDENDENDEENIDLSNTKDDTVLSMSFDIIVLTSFSLLKLIIKPIEQEIHDLISNQEDLVHYPDLAYEALCRFHLIDKYINKSNQNKGKFIQIFDYLFETSQIYLILKSLWILNSEDTCLISDTSLKVVLDWSWSKFIKIKLEINKIYKLISIQLINQQNHTYQYGEEIEHEHLTELLHRQNNLLDNLIQIFKQFIKLNSSAQGQIELNKKLCIIECAKCYVEHLNLFHKYELLLPLELTLNTDSSRVPRQRNIFREMDVNFKIIEKRWTKRKEEKLNQVSNEENKYPFTFMIDCLIEECKLNSNVTKFLSDKIDSKDEGIKHFYPPKSFNDLLEICLESNLSTKLKQIIILYVLCDLMHTEFSDDVKKQILKVINAYCSATFTIMSTTLDSSLSVPWSSSSTSIIAVANENLDNPTHSSCLFDLVNGFYLVDSRNIEKAFIYLRTAEIQYLELYEKYFILYNSLHQKEYKLAIQYLWLFQKLNTSSMSNIGAIIPNQSISHSNDQQNFFRFFSKSYNSTNELKSNSVNLIRGEQYMHLRVMITIYLANTLWNEAFEFIKSYLKQIKMNHNSNTPSDKLGKEIVIHFFSECEKFNLIKQVSKACISNQDLNEIFVYYLEAKQDMASITLAINLHIENRNYARACYLYNRYNKQLVNSGDSYLASLIEEIKNENSKNMAEQSKSNILITQEDIKSALSYEYRFTSTINDLCKNSKRCMKILSSQTEDSEYINLMKLPEIEYQNPNITMPTELNPSSKNEDITLLSKTSLDFSILKRTSSTPQSIISNKKQRNSPILKSLCNKLVAPYSEVKESYLPSSLKRKSFNTNSVSKSVKFLGSKTTRRISENERYIDKEEVLDVDDAENEEQKKENKTLNVNLFLNDEEDESTKDKVDNHSSQTNVSCHLTETTEINTVIENMADEPVFKEINEQNDSFRAAKAEIEAEVFSSKIEQIYQIKPDLNLFSSITPTKKQSIYENLIAKNSTSLPVNRITTSSVKFSFNESNAKNQEGETKEITQIVSQIQDKNTEVILNYSNNISMEEFNDTNVRKLEQSIDRETNLKESKKAELDAELYNAKLNFKANLSFFNSVTPSRLENDSEEKMLQIKNSRSLPFKRFEKSSDSMLQIIENKTEVNTNTNDININNESKLEESVVSIQSDVSIEKIEDNAKDSEHEINEEIHANEIYDVVTEKSKLESQKVEKEVIHEADEKSEDSNKENGEIKKDHYKVMIEDTDSDSELPDLVVKNSNTVVNESINEDQNECTANKTTINEHLNDVTLKYYRPVEDDVSSSEASDIDEVASSQQSAIVISQKKTDLNRSIDSKSSIIIECTIDQNTQESTADQSVSKDNNSSNTSFDLNMSSISANNSPSKLALHMKPLISTNELLSLPTGEEHSKSMSRNSSASSLFSHISSVSQQYEQSQEKYEEKLKKSVRKRIQPSTRNKEPQRHMDDNELSIKKATEEAIESRQEKVMIKRRKSDLSSTSSSSNSTANIEAVAKLRANLQQIPSSFGSNETEVRVTRSKLRALIEPTDNVIEIEKPTKATVTRTRSARTTKKLEDLNEEASNTSPKMSISNLKKHNAAFEKMDEILNQQNSVENDNESVNTKKTARSRNTRKATRSPSPTASSCVSESTIASTNATATKANTKTTRGKAKTAKQEATIEENCSPTSSVVSIASTSSRYSMRERKIETSIEPTTSGSSATASATKTVKTKAKTTKLESSETALAAAPEVAKVKRTRSNLKKAELEKITEAEVIALIEDSEDGFSTSQDTIASQGPKKSSLTRSASVNDDLAKRTRRVTRNNK